MDRAPRGISSAGANAGSQRRTANAPNATQLTRRKIIDGLNGYIELAAFGLGAMGDVYSSYVIERVGPRWSEAMADAAMANAQLRYLLDKATDAGTWGAVVITSVSLITPVIANHTPIPDNLRQFIGTMPIRLAQISAEDWQAHIEKLRREDEALARAMAQDRRAA